MPPDASVKLTSTELALLRLWWETEDRETARECLGIATQTFEYHRRNLCLKMGVGNIIQAFGQGLARGLLRR